MKDVARTPEEAARERVWQYEPEVAEAEAPVKVREADGTQLVDSDGATVAGCAEPTKAK